MDTYWVKMYNSKGELMEEESRAISGFGLTSCKIQAQLSYADALMVQNKNTMVTKYYVAEYIGDSFLRWKEEIPEVFNERIGQA